VRHHGLVQALHHVFGHGDGCDPLTGRGPGHPGALVDPRRVPADHQALGALVGGDGVEEALELGFDLVHAQVLVLHGQAGGLDLGEFGGEFADPGLGSQDSGHDRSPQGMAPAGRRRSGGGGSAPKMARPADDV